jgi:hypothetical protein
MRLNLRAITQAMVIAITIMLIIWDVFVYFKGTNATISVQIWDWSKNYPMVPFVAGVWCGHLFWAQKDED